MPNYLWEFLFEDGDKVPTLVPPGVDNTGLNNAKSFNIKSLQEGGGGKTFTPVNVVKHFYWTNSKLQGKDQTGRQEVPFIVLKERRVKTSSFVAQALYSTGAVFDSAKTVANALKLGNFDLSSATNIANIGSDKVSEFLKKDGEANNLNDQDTIKRSQSLKETIFKKLNDAVNAAKDDSSFLTDPWLSYYKGLYITEPTGWVYFLPYMANRYQSTNNTWGEGSGDSGGKFFLEGASKLVEGISEFSRNIMGSFEVGSYQEKAKFYQFAKDGDTITVSFPLINTGNATFNDVVRNWQFIFLLLYQNKALRVDRNVVNPPPIYEVEIPGLKYMPLSYISNINVDFKGARRTMSLPLPTADGSGYQDIETIIPDAYQISIDIVSLVSETKNFMYSTVFNKNNIKVITAAERDAIFQPGLPDINPQTRELVKDIA